jgi:hypothetical protein
MTYGISAINTMYSGSKQAEDNKNETIQIRLDHFPQQKQ